MDVANITENAFIFTSYFFKTYLSVMTQQPWYKDWFNSPYYHLLYQQRNENEAQQFIERLIAYLKPNPAALMIDIACGKGRHSKALADMGFDVTGIDLSEASIAEALKDESDKLHFFQHDMRLPFFINYFDFAFNFFTSFGYFKTQREHHNAIRTIIQSLKKDGIFVIDFLNVQYISDRLVKSHNLLIDDVQFSITKWQDERYFFKQIKVLEANNTANENSYTERVAKFSLADFKAMLACFNTEIIAVFGDYDLGEYQLASSPRLIIVAKKLG